MSKNTFFKTVLEEIQRVEASLWEFVSENPTEIPHKIEYMQELIVQILRCLNDLEVEILLFRVEKSSLGKEVEKELEDLYVLLEKQRQKLNEISSMNKDDIKNILNGDNAGKLKFSESSEKIKNLISKASQNYQSL